MYKILIPSNDLPCNSKSLLTIQEIPEFLAALENAIVCSFLVCLDYWFWMRKMQDF